MSLHKDVGMLVLSVHVDDMLLTAPTSHLQTISVAEMLDKRPIPEALIIMIKQPIEQQSNQKRRKEWLRKEYSS